MSTPAMKKVGFWTLLKLFIKSWFRQSALTPSLQDRPAYEGIAKKPKKHNVATRTMRYIVMHSYHAKQKQKRRGKAIKRRLSYVSSAILEDFGEILSRRERRRRTAFTPYYN